jgi:tRNA A-37 threonylcarbamoyl transferase component Bud32
MYVVIMCYVKGDHANDTSPLDKKQVEALKEAVSILHDQELVFGDLRRPNVILGKDLPKNILVVDFDWCGIEGEARYPADINMDRDGMGWHEDVKRRGLIHKEHDWHLFERLITDGTMG